MFYKPNWLENDLQGQCPKRQVLENVSSHRQSLLFLTISEKPSARNYTLLLVEAVESPPCTSLGEEKLCSLEVITYCWDDTGMSSPSFISSSIYSTSYFTSSSFNSSKIYPAPSPSYYYYSSSKSFCVSIFLSSGSWLRVLGELMDRGVLTKDIFCLGWGLKVMPFSFPTPMCLKESGVPGSPLLSLRGSLYKATRISRDLLKMISFRGEELELRSWYCLHWGLKLLKSLGLFIKLLVVWMLWPW